MKAFLLALLINGPMILIQPVHAVTDKSGVQLDFVFTWNNSLVASTSTQYIEQDNAFSLQSNGVSHGLFHFLFQWEGDYKIHGTTKSNPLFNLTTKHNNSTWAGKEYQTVMSLKEDNSFALTITPKAKDPLDEKLTLNTQEPAIAILNAINQFNREVEPVCKGIYHIWDGRRRYDLAFVHIGTRLLELEQEGGWRGQTILCEIKHQSITKAEEANLPPDEWEDNEPGQRQIWFAKFADLGWIPVYINMKATFGRVQGWLRTDQIKRYHSIQNSCNLKLCK